MIYIINTTNPQVVYVPASEKKVEGTLTFILRSTVNRKQTLSVSVAQEGMSDIYYKFTLTLSNTMQDGEYEFELKKGTTLLDSGLAMVGTSSTPITDNNTVIEYEQYESE